MPLLFGIPKPSLGTSSWTCLLALLSPTHWWGAVSVVLLHFCTTCANFGEALTAFVLDFPFKDVIQWTALEDKVSVSGAKSKFAYNLGRQRRGLWGAEGSRTAPYQRCSFPQGGAPLLSWTAEHSQVSPSPLRFAWEPAQTLILALLLLLRVIQSFVSDPGVSYLPSASMKLWQATWWGWQEDNLSPFTYLSWSDLPPVLTATWGRYGDARGKKSPGCEQ